MSNSGWYRYAPLSGIVFVVLLVVAMTVFQLPAIDASGDEILGDFVKDREMAFTSIVFAALAASFLAVFVGTIATELRAEEGESARLAPIVAGSGWVMVALMFGGTAAEGALAFDAEALEAGDARLLFTLFVEALSIASFPLSLFILGTSIGFLRSGSFDAWLGWVGLAAAVLAFTGLTQMYATDGFWSFTGAWGYIAVTVPALWIALVSVALAFPQVAHHRLPTAGGVARA